MDSFNGVATKYLQNYLNWFLVLEKIKNSTSKMTIITAIAFASNTTATDWANTTIASNPYSGQGGSSSTTNGYAYFGGTGVSVIDKFPFASQTNASDIGDLSVHRWYGTGGHSSTTYGYSSGGWTGNPNVQNVIDKVSFATDGNATDVGDLTVARKQQAGANY